MPNLSRYKVWLLALVMVAGAALAGVPALEKAFASSPPTMTWGSFTGSITGGSGVAVVGTGVTGQRIILQYANLAATAAGIIVLQEKSTGGALTTIATIDATAAGLNVLPTNDYFGGSGWVTASGSSIVITAPSTLTVTANVRYLAN